MSTPSPSHRHRWQFHSAYPNSIRPCNALMSAVTRVKRLRWLQVIYRILVSTYQRRINARYIDGEEQFHAIEYEIADSSRESSCVVALTITAEPKNWEQATRVAVQEAQRMQHHGVTQSELDQYMAALMSSSAQQAAATDTTPHIEMLELAMECLTNGQVFNSNIQAHEVRPCAHRAVKGNHNPLDVILA